MRDKHYKLKAFRLSDEIQKELDILKRKTNLSYNLLFKELLKKYNENT